MSKGKEFKRPLSKRSKRFKVEEQREEKVNCDSLNPIFSFFHMPYRGSFCLTGCSQSDKTSVADKLVELSQLTWNAIISSPRTGLGFEKIPQRQFKVILPKIVTPEVTIKVFRHSQGGRIAGFRENQIYHILAIGDDLYDH